MPLSDTGIAMNLGENGGGRYRTAARIAIDDGQLLHRKVNLDGIDEQIIGPDRECFHGAAHGQARRLIDVNLVDFKNIRAADSPCNAAQLDLLSERFARARIENFAVVQAPNGTGWIEYDGSGENWTKEAAAANLIDTGNLPKAAFPRLAFVGTDATDRHGCE